MPRGRKCIKKRKHGADLAIFLLPQIYVQLLQKHQA